jgi:hypothetical protein
MKLLNESFNEDGDDDDEVILLNVSLICFSFGFNDIINYIYIYIFNNI